MPEPIRIEIYSRPGCHLCDDAKTAVERAGARYNLELRVTDVDRSADLARRYGDDIPVVFLNGEEVFRHRVDEKVLERKMKELWNKSTS